ncbi:hypothetical protein [Halogranum amylolyticum]|nr:hypothetical protein [Halogranum amylolyticum]
MEDRRTSNGRWRHERWERTARRSPVERDARVGRSVPSLVVGDA